jgi:hypothetical protein
MPIPLPYVWPAGIAMGERERSGRETMRTEQPPLAATPLSTCTVGAF